jgi:hypothetical protein
MGGDKAWENNGITRQKADEAKLRNWTGGYQSLELIHRDDCGDCSGKFRNKSGGGK